MTEFRSMSGIDQLPPREREVARAVYRLTEASAAEVWMEVRGASSHSAVRVMLSRLVKKGVISRSKSLGRVTYSPTLITDGVKQAAVVRLLESYFDGSPEKLLQCLHAERSHSPRC
ncbi:MAG TPA: BlaI/MecI/CopY family transcriptional regulator [Sphingomicrobium sp.]